MIVKPSSFTSGGAGAGTVASRLSARRDRASTGSDDRLLVARSASAAAPAAGPQAIRARRARGVRRAPVAPCRRPSATCKSHDGDAVVDEARAGCVASSSGHVDVVERVCLRVPHVAARRRRRPRRVRPGRPTK